LRNSLNKGISSFLWKLGGGETMEDDHVDDYYLRSCMEDDSSLFRKTSDLTEYCDDDSDDDCATFEREKKSKRGFLFSSGHNLSEECDDESFDGLQTNHRGVTIDEDFDFVFENDDRMNGNTSFCVNDEEGSSRRGSTASNNSYGERGNGSNYNGGSFSMHHGDNHRRTLLKHEKYKNQLSQLHKQYSRDELLAMLKETQIEEAVATIVNGDFDKIKKEMKKNGFKTHLALLQVSRDLVETTIIREIEMAESRKYLFERRSSIARK